VFSAIYSPALRAGFIWDDDVYVTQNKRESFAAHVDGLFVRTKLAGLWADFYRCACCGGFLVKLLHGARKSLYCSPACRLKAYRSS